jgi:predicted unusual protein kinase regulating ubiquinone biosynthesis (AarF/ABC1/UbiB family)
LRDGRPVVVKVQRPGIAQQIADDFEVLAQIAELMDTHTEIGRRYRFLDVLEQFRITIQQELNYEREAQNLISVGENLREFHLIEVPQPVRDYSTRRVLTMDYVKGRKITTLSPLARLDIEGSRLAEQLFRAYLKQVLVDGLFHADPHPGNVFLTSDGRIALLDLGMAGHTTPAMQENLLKILLAVSEGKGDDASDVIIAISRVTEDYDASEFKRLMSRLLVLRQDQRLEQINVGTTLLEVSKTACDCGLYVPSELTLLGKTLLQLDEVGKILDPEFEPNLAIRRNAAEIMSRRVGKDATQGSVLRSLLEMKDFVASLPNRLNKIMDAVANAEIEVKIKAVDANLVMEGFQKIANRITSGIILAALIIGAALLMRIETSFRIFGYPGLAIICFLAATAGGCWLLVAIYRQDQKIRKKR